jgi:hypothetical protein
MNLLRFKGKSTDERFNELEEEERSNKLAEARANLEGKVAQVDPAKNNNSTKIEGGLAFSCGSFLYVLDLKIRKVRKILQRGDNINALAVNDGKLYDAGKYFGIFDTSANKAIAWRDNSTVFALVSYDGKLYDAGGEKQVYDTFENRSVAERENAICALASHDGKLYDAGFDRKIFDTLTNQVIVQRTTGYILALASHNGHLYHSEGDRIFHSLSNNELAHRTSHVWALASHDGVLCDGGNYCGIFDALNDIDGKNPIYSLGATNAMCSLPQTLFEELWSRGKDI